MLTELLTLNLLLSCPPLISYMQYFEQIIKIYYFISLICHLCTLDKLCCSKSLRANKLVNWCDSDK